MAGIKTLVTLAFTGSIGMTMIILACGLPQYKLWWPFFVVLFYVLAPIPTLLARRYTEHQGSSNSCLETAIFITMGLIVSAFALPIVLARVAVIQWGACYLTLAGNIVIFITLLGFFLTFDQDDSDYNMW
jgi:hypothetical protein